LLGVGVLAAVHRARQTGQGQFVDVGMYDAMLALSERIVYQHSITGEIPGRDGNEHPLFAPFGTFACEDGWVSIAAPSDDYWASLARIMGNPALADDPRFSSAELRWENREEVHRILGEW